MGWRHAVRDWAATSGIIALRKNADNSAPGTPVTTITNPLRRIS